MGFSWVPWIAQVAAEDVLAHCIRTFPLIRQYDFLQQGAIAAQFFCNVSGRPLSSKNGSAYVYIDDFGGWLLVKGVRLPKYTGKDQIRAVSISAEARHDCDRICDEFKKRGLDVHKINFGLPSNLGYEVVESRDELGN